MEYGSLDGVEDGEVNDVKFVEISKIFVTQKKFPWNDIV